MTEKQKQRQDVVEALKNKIEGAIYDDVLEDSQFIRYILTQMTPEQRDAYDGASRIMSADEGFEVYTNIQHNLVKEALELLFKELFEPVRRRT